jgi:hypothetical protein
MFEYCLEWFVWWRMNEYKCYVPKAGVYHSLQQSSTCQANGQFRSCHARPSVPPPSSSWAWPDTDQGRSFFGFSLGKFVTRDRELGFCHLYLLRKVDDRMSEGEEFAVLLWIRIRTSSEPDPSRLIFGEPVLSFQTLETIRFRSFNC